MWSDTFRNNHVEIVIQTINLLITAEGKKINIFSEWGEELHCGVSCGDF